MKGFRKNPSNIGCLTLFRPIFLYIDLVVPGEHFLIRVNVQQFKGYTRPYLTLYVQGNN